MFPRGNWSVIYQSSRLNIPENWNFNSTALRTSDPVNEKYYYSTYHSTEWAIANGSIRRTCGRPFNRMGYCKWANQEDLWQTIQQNGLLQMGQSGGPVADHSTE
jgi:hypothetical protein